MLMRFTILAKISVSGSKPVREEAQVTTYIIGTLYRFSNVAGRKLVKLFIVTENDDRDIDRAKD